MVAEVARVVGLLQLATLLLPLAAAVQGVHGRDEGAEDGETDDERDDHVDERTAALHVQA